MIGLYAQLYKNRIVVRNLNTQPQLSSERSA